MISRMSIYLMNNRNEMISYNGEYLNTSKDVLDWLIEALNQFRLLYLVNKDKQYWWQMIQLLPSSYNQKRTVMLNYEVLVNMYQHRKEHKLDEWREFCLWAQELPYSELITEGGAVNE